MECSEVLQVYIMRLLILKNMLYDKCSTCASIYKDTMTLSTIQPSVHGNYNYMSCDSRGIDDLVKTVLPFSLQKVANK
jgi:hypothetical protein